VRNFPKLLKMTAHLLMVSTALMPLHTLAEPSQPSEPQDFFSQIGREGQSFGDSMGAIAKDNQATVQNGQMSIPMQDGSGIQLDINTLYPGTNPANSGSESDYFSGGTEPDVSTLQSVFDSDFDMGDSGRTSKENMWNDAFSGTPSISGAAYKVLVDSANLSRPDFTSDPMLSQSALVYENIDVIASGFGDCSSDTTFNNISMNVHNPEYETCDRITDKTATCDVFHDYDAAVLRHHSGPYNLAPCNGEANCSNLWIGRIGDNYWSGNCTIYEEFTEVVVVNPDAITSATLVRAKWDDYMQIWVGQPGSEIKVWAGPNNNFPPETTAGRCELETSWDSNPNLDLTSYFKNAAEGSVIRFKIRVSVSGSGEGYGQIKIKYDPEETIVEDEWRPESCLESGLGVADGFADGSLTCVNDPRNAEGCVFLNGVEICETHLQPSPLPGIPNLCKQVAVVARFDFFRGDLECYTDINGNEVCPVNEGQTLNTCTELENNPQCGFISSGCVEGAKGPSGVCYVQEEVWDCGSSVQLDTVEKQTEYTCSGSIRCMGNDCLDPTKSKNQTDNFIKASALLNAAQFMTQDMACTGVDENGNATGNENVTCSAFGGTPGECKIAVGGVADCCEKPTNIGMADYLAMIMAVPKLDSALTSLEGGNAASSLIQSSYQSIREPVMQQWSSVTKPFTSHMDNISGAIDEYVTTPLSELKTQMVDKLKGEMKSILKEVMGSAAEDTATDAAATAAADAAADEAAEQMATAAIENATAFLGAAMTIYTAYVVAVAIVQMVYACEQEEFEMNAKRATDSCTYVGSYCKSKVLGSCIEKRKTFCCFNSPLSRIIQEQVKPQLGQGFGSAKSPSCEGIPLDKISTINWDLVNFDEWIAILKQTGNFPSEDSLNLDNLTGSGSVYNIDGNRLNATERALQRTENVDLDAKRREAAGMVPIIPR